MNSTLRSCVTAGVAVVGASVIAVTPVAAPLPDVYVPNIQLTAGAEDIVIDFVRHGQVSPPNTVALNGLPGYPLSALGEQQATTVGNQLFTELGPVAGIFGGYEQRMSETAVPFLTDEGFPSQLNAAYGAISPGFTPLDGFNEISGGMYANDPPSSPGDILYELTVFSWVLGYGLVPMPGSNDYNGVQFDENFGSAVDTAYSDGVADGVVSHNGHITDVVFSGEAGISTWTLMNANNPDVAILMPLFLESLVSKNVFFLDNAGQVVIEGNPTDGWTLISFNGLAMPQNPGLLTDLIVDQRNLIMPPQTAAYDLSVAAFTGDPTTIGKALVTGAQDVAVATVRYPIAVIQDVVTAGQDLVTAIASGENFIDAFASVILGVPF